MAIKSGLNALVASVQAYFAANGVTANAVIGWKQPTEQINQGPGGANRVVFIPSAPSGAGGKINAAEQPGLRGYAGTSTAKLGAVIHTGAGTSVATATGTPSIDFRAKVKITLGGTIGTGPVTLQYSTDNGTTYSVDQDLGTATSFVIPGTGCSIFFAPGTVLTNQVEAFYGNAVGSTWLRALVTWERNVVVSVWAVDATAPQDEAAQIEAVETLFEWTIRAVQAFAKNNGRWGDTSWTTSPVEAIFGRELRASLTFKHPMFDSPYDAVDPTFVITPVLSGDSG